jgi:hypothetical protein
VTSECHRHTHPHAFVSELGHERTTATVASGSVNLCVFVELVEQLAQWVGSEPKLGILLRGK